MEGDATACLISPSAILGTALRSGKTLLTLAHACLVLVNGLSFKRESTSTLYTRECLGTSKTLLALINQQTTLSSNHISLIKTYLGYCTLSGGTSQF